MAPLPSKRTAFTLVELLVVIAIIGVLVALLLPAIQAAREAGRRCSCQNNLTQLILGVHNYENAHSVYPPGTIDNAKGPIVNAALPGSYHHSWIVQILPFIDQQNTWDAIDKTVGVYHPLNSAPVALDLRLVRCPSHWLIGANSDYAAVHHDLEKPIDAMDNGVFFLNSRIAFEDVKDGVSNTFFVGEKGSDKTDFGWMSGTRGTLRNTGALAPATPPGRAAPPGGPLFVGGFGSSHPASSNFALGDGRVTAISYKISPTVLQDLGHRADGKIISPW